MRRSLAAVLVFISCIAFSLGKTNAQSLKVGMTSKPAERSAAHLAMRTTGLTRSARTASLTAIRSSSGAPNTETPKNW